MNYVGGDRKSGTNKARDRRDADVAADGHGAVSEQSVEDVDSVAESVVFAVSAMKDTDPTELEPLHGVVNVDALENLFAPKADGTPRPAGTVSFTYGGCSVTVRGNERVKVEPSEETGPTG